MSAAQRLIKRFSFPQRIEHFVLLASFTILGVTGLPQKYPLSPISQGLISVLGGIETVRIIHRVAATVFLLEAIYHLVVVGYMLWVERRQATMMPTVKDGTDAIQTLLYNLGIRKTPPEMGRYNFAEKMEYLAMLWGFLVMAATGFMLWNPIMTTNLLPGQFIPAAKIAHGGEAILAVLAIILWHFYHVHIRRWNTSIFTGYISREAMEEEHAAELRKIEAGQAEVVVNDPARQRRAKVYIPVAAVVSVVLLAGVYWFVSYEKSAITTLPPSQQSQIFAPQTATPAPTATQAPTAGPTSADQGSGSTGAAAVVTWDGGLKDVFAKKCGSCHGTQGGFSAKNYADVLDAVKPGDAADSEIVVVQQGKHPGKFSDEELSQVVDWINAGAPEK